jgi:hypothetical protein
MKLVSALAGLLVLTLAALPGIAASSQQREDAYVACLIGNAAVSLHKQHRQGGKTSMPKPQPRPR